MARSRRTYLGSTGDCNPIDHDGGVVFRTESGVTWEACISSEGTTWLHCLDVPASVLEYYGQSDIDAAAQSCGIDSAEATRMASSANIMERVGVMEMLSMHMGLEAMEPSEVITRGALARRWKPFLSRSR
jgi:hypothetical protein